MGGMEEWKRFGSHRVNANTIDTLKKKIEKGIDKKDRWYKKYIVCFKGCRHFLYRRTDLL